MPVVPQQLRSPLAQRFNIVQFASHRKLQDGFNNVIFTKFFVDGEHAKMVEFIIVYKPDVKFEHIRKPWVKAVDEALAYALDMVCGYESDWYWNEKRAEQELGKFCMRMDDYGYSTRIVTEFTDVALTFYVFVE